MNLDSESSFNHLVKIISNKDTNRNQEILKQERNPTSVPKINYLSAKLIKFVKLKKLLIHRF